MTVGGITGIILAGGMSRRMGRNKALLDLGGRPMIAVIVERLQTLADEIIIVADDRELYAPFAEKRVADVFAGVGTLGGVHAGLQAATYDLGVVVGCDMPFLNPQVLAWFIEAAEEADAVVLQQGAWLEPLHAVYRRCCLPVIELAIRAGERRAYAICDELRVRYVAPAEITHLDPDLRSFRNVNTPEEWQMVTSRAVLTNAAGQEAEGKHVEGLTRRPPPSWVTDRRTAHSCRPNGRPG